MKNLIIITVLCTSSIALNGQNNQPKMSLEELKDEIEFDNLYPKAKIGIDEFINYYDSIYETTKLVFGKVKAKYKFENIHQFYGDGTGAHGEIHLEFATGVGLDFSTIICLNNGGNVDDDSSFGKIIEDGWSEKINWNELINDKGWNQFYKIVERLFYSWIAYIWQDVKGYETGLKVSIIDASGSQKFSLNDFHWFRLSNFVDFDEPARKVENQFAEPLTIKEIYKRTGMKVIMKKEN